jgi:hypothetical protein
MAILHLVNKGAHMNSLVQFCIQLYSHHNELMYKQYAGDRNPLCELACDLQLQYNT